MGSKLQPRVKSQSTPQSKKKGKGLRSGNKNVLQDNKSQLPFKGGIDPKVGSKKKIPLMDQPTPEIDKKEAQAQLVQLENDPRLNRLLDKIEQGATIHVSDKKWMNQQLNEIERLLSFLELDTDIEDKDESDANKNPLDALDKSLQALEQYKDDQDKTE